MSPYKDTGSFVPATNIWDPAEIREVDVRSPQFKELLVRLYQNLNNISVSLNGKNTGIYTTDEFVTGKQFFPDPSLTSASGPNPILRPVYRKTINFGALPNATSKTVAHGLTLSSGYSFTDVYGTASDTSGNSYIPIPYASATAANNIEISVDATNVTITTGINRVAYTTTYVVVEYVKF